MNAMNTQPGMEERLWDYIDGTASAQEVTVIGQLLQSDSEWKQKYAELLEVSSLLRASETDMPSLRFTRNVMEEIAKLHIAPATKTYINKKIIFGIGFFFISLIAGFLIYGFSQMGGGTDGDSTNTVVQEVNKIDFGKFFNNKYLNVLMMINLVIGLFLLDNYLGRKRKAWRAQHP